MTPSIRATREGFPLAAACHYYLGYAGDVIYGRSEDGHGALHDGEGNLLPAGSRIVVPHLADTLELLADEGDRAFYRGELGRRIVDYVQDRGGLLTMDDLARYTPHVHESLTVKRRRLAHRDQPAAGHRRRQSCGHAARIRHRAVSRLGRRDLASPDCHAGGDDALSRGSSGWRPSKSTNRWPSCSNSRAAEN